MGQRFLLLTSRHAAEAACGPSPPEPSPPVFAPSTSRPAPGTPGSRTRACFWTRSRGATLTRRQDARGHHDAGHEAPAQLNRQHAEAHDAHGGPLGAAGPAHSFRARPARQRPPDTKHRQHRMLDRTRPTTTTHDTSGSQQLPAPDRATPTRTRSPSGRTEQRAGESFKDTGALPRTPAQLGDRGRSHEGGRCGRRRGEGGSVLAPPRPVIARVCQTAAEGYKAKSVPWPAHHGPAKDRCLPDRGDTQASARGASAARHEVGSIRQQTRLVDRGARGTADDQRPVDTRLDGA